VIAERLGVGYERVRELNPAAVYASISKELDVPLRFPGKPGAYTSLIEMTDADLLARATVWAATNPDSANQAYNITNGDYFRWQHVWPKIASVFDMPSTEPQPHSLVELMAGKAPLWDAMVKKYGLRPYGFKEAVAWPFGDYVFSCNWDVMSDLTKSRQHGFQRRRQQRFLLPPAHLLLAAAESQRRAETERDRPAAEVGP